MVRCDLQRSDLQVSNTSTVASTPSTETASRLYYLYSVYLKCFDKLQVFFTSQQNKFT